MECFNIKSFIILKVLIETSTASQDVTENKIICNLALRICQQMYSYVNFSQLWTWSVFIMPYCSLANLLPGLKTLVLVIKQGDVSRLYETFVLNQWQ